MDEMPHSYPLKLSYIPKTALWGGTRLKEAYGKPYDGEKLAETWELSCRGKENCMIENGACAGLTLAEYFGDYGEGAIGTAHTGGRFPLLIKFIDARDKLSVQVHPDDAYAALHENDPGKTEMWYIVEADEGAELIYGLADGVDAGAFSRAVKEGRIGEAVKRVPVKAGETYFIPSGMLHAIGAGILVAEIQQNSDLTYRVYDYDRRDKNGDLRPLHTEKALAVTRPYTEEEIAAVRYARSPLPEERAASLLADCPYFRVERLGEGKHALSVCRRSFLHLLCTDGEGTLSYGKEEYPVVKGDSYFLPAGLGEVILEGNGTYLLTSLPR